MTLTVLPKPLATLTLANANPTLKVGGQVEVVVKVSRLFDYAGEFKVSARAAGRRKGVDGGRGRHPGRQGRGDAGPEGPGRGRAGRPRRPGRPRHRASSATSPSTHEAKFNVNVVK